LREPWAKLDEVRKKSHHSTSHGDVGNGGSNSSSALLGSCGARLVSGGTRGTRSGVGGVGRLAGRSDLCVVVILVVHWEGTRVVVCGPEVGICLLDNIKNTVTSRTVPLSSRDGPDGREHGVLATSHGTGVGLVETQVGGVNIPVDVAGLVGDQLEDVGTAVLNINCQKLELCKSNSIWLTQRPREGRPQLADTEAMVE